MVRMVKPPPPEPAHIQVTMTPEDVRAARFALGKLWGMGRALKHTEFSRVLGYAPTRAQAATSRWEHGKRSPPPAAVIAINMMLEGARPPGLERELDL
ncbi:hypothetical protein [uncultured Alsobacter sp.]|uniref:helix-turn-helix domain-containing protein n=1 Tax=uncultured Alsobacter sp. TaxID=1748258 RepID=UPI0025CEDB7E|nr:hypothetical protein [uncultured Alsobacter sp.]